MYDDSIEVHEALALIRGIYRCDDAARFADETLGLLLRATNAEAGVAAVRARSTDTWTVAGSIGPHPMELTRRAAETLKGFTGGRAGGVCGNDDLHNLVIQMLGWTFEEAVPVEQGPALLLLEPGHRRIGRSLWILAYRAAPEAGIKALCELLVPHIGYAGELLLPRTRELLPEEVLDQPPEAPDHQRELARRLDAMFPEQPDGERRAEGLSLEGLPEGVRDCVHLAAKGHTNVQIAAALNISTATVARRLHQAYVHLHIVGRSGLDYVGLLTGEGSAG